MLVEEAGEARAADLLLALEQEAHVERQRPVAAMNASRRFERDDDRPLVVGRAARVDAPVAHARLERRRLPTRPRRPGGCTS